MSKLRSTRNSRSPQEEVKFSLDDNKRQQDSMHNGLNHQKQKKCRPRPRVINIVDDTETDLDSSFDCAEDTSSSMDMVQHTVKADLYGTDKDPSYVDDEACGNPSSGQVQQVGRKDSNVNGTRSVEASHSSNQLMSPRNIPHTPTSFGGLFTNCSGQMQASNASSDVEVYRQSYMNPDDSQNYSNGCQNQGSSYQERFYRNSASNSMEHVTNQDYGGGQIVKRNIEHRNPQNGKVVVEVRDENGCYTGFHGNNSGQQVSPEQPQYPTLPQQYLALESFIQTGEQGPYNKHRNTKPANLGYQMDSNGQYLSPTGYRREFADDQNMAAEQLASELVKTYGGQNSHMISDMLKENGSQEDFSYGGFERAGELGTPNQQISTPQVIRDVLNTPRQLEPVDFSNGHPNPRPLDPRHGPTSEAYGARDGGYQASVTYNDVHVHGGKWSTMYNDGNESPYPPQQQNLRSSSTGDLLDRHRMDDMPSNGHAGYSFQDYISQRGGVPNRLPNDQFPPAKNNQLTSPTIMSSGHDQGDVTKTTFTSREHMQMHLSNKLKNKCGGRQSMDHPLCKAEYSSIYPSKDFIERTTRPVHQGPSNPDNYNANSTQSDGYIEREHNRNSNQDSNRPIKKRRISKYSTDDIRVPPQIPIFDEVGHKYFREDAVGSKHKYFVVNPSEAKDLSPKTLLTKYIDFLIGENEQITEISKSVNPPVDIYVTEDMYFMDSLKFQVPFPSRKFVNFVSSFYPRIDLQSMRFKGRPVKIPGKKDILKVDPRPTQQILEDTFYYFQRELMNV